MLPRKTFGIAIRLGNDRNEDEALQFTFEAFVNVVSFKQSIVRVFIEVNIEWFFDSRCEFFFQSVYKLRYPAAPVIIVAVGNEDVVLETRN